VVDVGALLDEEGGIASGLEALGGPGGGVN